MAHQDIYRNGKRLVSATELMSIIDKPFLHKWRESLCCPSKGLCGFEVGRQKADEAAGLGNEIHADFEAWLKGNEVTGEWIGQIKSKLAPYKIKPYLIEPEETLIDGKSGLAGSPDAVLMWDDVPVIADLKVKNQLDDLTALQGCAYRYLIKRKFGVEINTMKIVWAKKKTKSKLVEVVDIDLLPWVEDWKALIRVWNRVSPGRIVTVHDK